jgi:hypothetical protein
MRFTVAGSLLALAGAFTLAACSDSSNDLDQVTSARRALARLAGSETSQ